MQPQACGDFLQAISTGKWVLNVKPMFPFIIDLASAYHCDFRGGIYDDRWLGIEPSGPLSSLAKADEQGLRIAIPAKTNCRGVGVYTRFGVHGDFEITASFEILKADKPREGGGVGPELYLRTVDGWSTFVAKTRAR
jgi:hypothetical protein